MKNFFKKLSFVMALAMIVSVITPAAGAFAADSLALSVKGTKYLYLGNATKSSLDVNLKGTKPAGAKYLWSSSKKSVATVDKYGVVKGVKQGKTTVSLAITKKDGSKSTLSVDFVVRNNIKEFTSIVSADGADLTKLDADKEYDLNGKFTTNGGSTTSTSSVARWSVDSDKATIDVKTGVFKASEAGTYKVTVNAFETATGADAWVALNDKTSTVGVKATGTFEVTVVTKLVSTKQVGASSFEVTFNADMSKTDLSSTTAVLAQIINGKAVVTGTEKIKEIKFDATGKIATVVLYTALKEKADYTFTYGTLVGSFTAVAKDLAAVASIEFADATFNYGGAVGTKLVESVVAKNKDGVVIFTGKDDAEFASLLSFTYTGELGKAYLSVNELYIYEEKYVAPVKVDFNYYSYNSTTKEYELITASDTAVVVAQTADTSLNTSSLEFALLPHTQAEPNDKTVWSGTTAKLASGDYGYYIVTRYKTNDAQSTDKAKVDDESRFYFESTLPERALVTGVNVYPNSQGTVTVLVHDSKADNKVVGSFELTILPARTLSTIELDNKYVTVSNNALYGDKGLATLATIKAADTMGDAAAVDVSYNAAKDVTVPKTGATAPTLVIDDTVAGKATIAVDASSVVDAGAYTFKLTITSGSVTRTQNITIFVADGKTNAAITDVTSWRLELSTASLDLKDVTTAKDLVVKMSGYNKNNVKIQELDTDRYVVAITKGGQVLKDTTAFDAATNTLDVVKEVGTTEKTLTVIADGTGVYNVLVTYKPGTVPADDPLKKVENAVIGSGTFTLSNTTDLKFTVDTPVVTGDTVLKMVQDAFTLKVNGTEVAKADEVNIVSVKYLLAGSTAVQESTKTLPGSVIDKDVSIIITEITYAVTNANTATAGDETITLHKFTPNAVIKAK